MVFTIDTLRTLDIRDTLINYMSVSTLYDSINRLTLSFFLLIITVRQPT